MNESFDTNMSNFSLTTNSSQVTIDTDLQFLMYLVYTIGQAYIFTIISVIGTILNLICLIVYANPKFKGDMYKYQLNKTVFEMATLAISMLLPFSNCSDCVSLGARIYRMYFMRIITNIVFTCAGFAEIGVTYDRLMLFKHNSLFPRFKFLEFFFVTFFSSILMFVPQVIASRIEEVAPNVYAIVSTPVGASREFTIYSIFTFVVQNIVTFIILIMLNYLLYDEYGRYYKKKIKLLNVSEKSYKTDKSVMQTTSTKTKAKSQDMSINATSRGSLAPNNAASKKNTEMERKFTLMILTSSLFFTLSRILEGTTSVIFHVDRANRITNNRVFIIFGWFAHLATYLSFSSNLIFSLIFNKIFRESFNQMIICKWKF
jgi:hypothetical protein